ncbi:hypothetical protein [Aphanothece sacrum]|uniref:NB-ARC domain-containing protein n=1 Tax=Aphanothece sacrum FPU1 TaxID=1920663 RepID=A0A401ILH4_APHSA|nr:hypothetical protein [Aphanothece sacrum]GBF82088.1 NB-ARC domain-containing protein [Aphanothece sacrum FPU1]GBF85022.1 hypothetical protein AsFPU3_2077 [Aphanothece sacrum FPU3]
MEPESTKISFKVVIILTDKAVFSNTGKHLSNIEVLVLQETLNGKKYPEIASNHGYTIEYLKNDVGPKLWRRLSYTFGEKVNKANVNIILQHQFYNEQAKITVETSNISVSLPQTKILSSPTQTIPNEKLSLPLPTNLSPPQSQVKQLENFAQIYFEKSLKSLQRTWTYQILMALALFPNGATEKAIMTVTELTNPDTVVDSLTQLEQMLLIEQTEEKYCLLPIAKNYVLAELKSEVALEKSLRERWVNWYLEITQRCDRSTFEKEKENLIEVMDWCILHHRYDQVKQLWQAIKFCFDIIPSM